MDLPKAVVMPDGLHGELGQLGGGWPIFGIDGGKLARQARFERQAIPTLGKGLEAPSEVRQK